MNTLSDIIDSYDQVASNYASKFLKELEQKPLDQLLLKDFAQGHGKKGKLVDFGCGPGQTTRFLSDNGAVDVLGLDISPAMISEAKFYHPSSESNAISFDVADMMNLQYEKEKFAGAIAFYSIVNFNYEQVAVAFREIYRVLQFGAHFLFSFHVGDQVVHLNEFLDKSVSITFFFLDPDRIIALLEEVGFQVIQTVIRYPYSDIEHPSKRAYITACKATATC